MQALQYKSSADSKRIFSCVRQGEKVGQTLALATRAHVLGYDGRVENDTVFSRRPNFGAHGLREAVLLFRPPLSTPMRPQFTEL